MLKREEKALESTRQTEAQRKVGRRSIGKKDDLVIRTPSLLAGLGSSGRLRPSLYIGTDGVVPQRTNDRRRLSASSLVMGEPQA